MKFTIDRAIWLHGEGFDGSCLLRKFDEKMCCLGIFLEACGVPREQLAGRASPANVHGPLPKQAGWLLRGSGILHSEDCQLLVDINDCEVTNNKARERAIAKEFAEHSVMVKFIGRRKAAT